MEDGTTNSLFLALGSNRQISCSLSTQDMRERKKTILSSLKAGILEKKVMANGFAYRFEGTDEILTLLTEFIRVERACCRFLVFTLSVSSTADDFWLNLTGPSGAKEFIQEELGL